MNPRDRISTHYSNDRPNLYAFPRRADPPWHPQRRRIDPDVIVVGVCLILLTIALWVTL